MPHYNSVGLGGGLRFCISDKLPGDADAVRPWTTLQIIRTLPILSDIPS